MIYSISQILIAMKSVHTIHRTDNFIPFQTQETKEHYLAEFVQVNSIDTPKNIVAEYKDYIVTKEKNVFCRYFFHSHCDGVIYARSIWDWINKKVRIEYISGYEEFLNETGNALFHIGLEQILLRENRLIFHAACVDTIYGGILFTGPPGAGKSTQADLWVNRRNGVLINGDRPILSKDTDGWKAWGSPYAGSSRCYVNKSCEVKAIVRVVKATENKVVHIKGGQAFSTVFSGITVNDWSREDVDMASELVIELVNSIPVYEMHCTNTEDAVETLEKVLKGE